MEMEALLQRLTKAVGALSGDDNQAKGADSAAEMTAEKFVVYVVEQIEKASSDKPEVRAARLKHLQGQIDAVRKNFEGPTPTPNGMFSVKMFTDPAQLSTTSTTKGLETPSAESAPSTFANNEVPPGQLVNATPTPGSLPPTTAGSSGFASLGEATFAKAMEGINEKLSKMIDGGDKPTGDKPTDDAGDRVDTKKGTTEPRVMWPLDITTESEDEPDWGFDAGSEAEKIAVAKRDASSKKPDQAAT